MVLEEETDCLIEGCSDLGVENDGFIAKSSDLTGVDIADIDGFTDGCSDCMGVGTDETDGLIDGCSDCSGVDIERLRRSWSESGGGGSEGRGSRIVFGLTLELEI